ncbi:hypothetical protein F5Y16DRAFT_399815 [Xylariaceae sp. FL0255]|nr:hypothetical protein F5Y16DRAFT_399815 [Xylariaceae sp. FL0255]
MDDLAMIILDERGDVTLKIGWNPPSNFRVCSRTLSRASPVFAAKLYPEEDNGARPSMNELDLPSDNPRAFKSILAAIHGQQDAVEKLLSTLVKSAIIESGYIMDQYYQSLVPDKPLGDFDLEGRAEDVRQSYFGTLGVIWDTFRKSVTAACKESGAPESRGAMCCNSRYGSYAKELRKRGWAMQPVLKICEDLSVNDVVDRLLKFNVEGIEEEFPEHMCCNSVKEMHQSITDMMATGKTILTEKEITFLAEQRSKWANAKLEVGGKETKGLGAGARANGHIQ